MSTPLATDSARRVLIGGLMATILTVALLAASQLIDFAVFDLRLHWLDADTHASVFGVVSLLAQAAAAAAIARRGTRSKRSPQAWLGLGALVAALILLRALVAYDPAAVGAPVAVVFCALFWLTRRDPRTLRTLVWAALALLVASLLLHQVGLDADVLNYSSHNWLYQISAVAKHGCELAGWMLLVTAITAGVNAGPPRRAFRAGPATPIRRDEQFVDAHVVPAAGHHAASSAAGSSRP